MYSLTLWQWVGATVIILLVIAILILFIIYYTSVGQDRVLRKLDLVLLSIRRKNILTLLETLASQETVSAAIKEVEELEDALEVKHKDFTKYLKKYNEIKKEVDERGYI